MAVSKYEAFLKTVELGTLTHAAEALGYTQSGMTHILNSLEEECGVKLLNRNRSGVEVTSDGQQLTPYFRNLVGSYYEMRNKTEELRDLESGLIRIGTFSSVSSLRLPQMIKAFNDAYPNIEFELINGEYYDIEAWVEEGTVDCGFTSYPVRDSLDMVFLERDKVVVVMAPDHPNAKLDKFPIEDLAKYPLIDYADNLDFEVRELVDTHDIKLDAKYIVVNDHALMAMVECGLGIGILTELILERTPYKIVEKELDKPAFRDIGIAVKKGSTLSSATSKFIDYAEAWEMEKDGKDNDGNN